MPTAKWEFTLSANSPRVYLARQRQASPEAGGHELWLSEALVTALDAVGVKVTRSDGRSFSDDDVGGGGGGGGGGSFSDDDVGMDFEAGGCIMIARATFRVLHPIVTRSNGYQNMWIGCD